MVEGLAIGVIAGGIDERRGTLAPQRGGIPVQVGHEERRTRGLARGQPHADRIKRRIDRRRAAPDADHGITGPEVEEGLRAAPRDLPGPAPPQGVDAERDGGLGRPVERDQVVGEVIDEGGGGGSAGLDRQAREVGYARLTSVASVFSWRTLGTSRLPKCRVDLGLTAALDADQCGCGLTTPSESGSTKVIA